jgi:hypothetical protein
VEAQQIAIPASPRYRSDAGRRYRRALGRRAAAAAVPYGYTVLTAATAGVLIDTQGPPTSAAAALFLLGAVLGFTLAAQPGATGSPRGFEAAPGLTGAGSGLAALAAFGVSAPIAHAVDGPVAFAAVGFVATTVYLAAGAAVGALTDHRDPEGSRRQ